MYDGQHTFAPAEGENRPSTELVFQWILEYDVFRIIKKNIEKDQKHVWGDQDYISWQAIKWRLSDLSDDNGICFLRQLI